MYTINDLYDLDHTLAKEWMEQYTYPWEMLKDIKMMILELGPTLKDYEEISPNVWVHPSAAIAPTAYLGAPCIIGANTEVRHCAFIRGSALVGENCVVGNSVELKNVNLRLLLPHGSRLDHVQREIGQDARCGQKWRGADRNGTEKIRRHAGRSCGGWMQQRPQSGHDHRPGHECLSSFPCPGTGAGSFHLQKRTGNGRQGKIGG